MRAERKDLGLFFKPGHFLPPFIEGRQAGMEGGVKLGSLLAASLFVPSGGQDDDATL